MKHFELCDTVDSTPQKVGTGRRFVLFLLRIEILDFVSEETSSHARLY